MNGRKAEGLALLQPGVAGEAPLHRRDRNPRSRCAAIFAQLSFGSPT